MYGQNCSVGQYSVIWHTQKCARGMENSNRQPITHTAYLTSDEKIKEFAKICCACNTCALDLGGGSHVTGLLVNFTDSLLLTTTGSLHFSYLTMSDEQNNRLYKCNVFNPYLDTTRGGSYARLHVTPGSYR